MYFLTFLININFLQETDTAALWIAGGTNRDDDDEINVNSFYVQFLSQIATTNKMVTAILYQVGYRLQ